MSDQEKMREEFETILPREIVKDNIREVYYTYSEYEAAFDGWQASRAQADAAHKEEIAKWAALVTTSEQIVILKNKQLAAAQLCIEQMREALKAIIKVHGYESGIPVDAVSLQPSMSDLRGHDAKVLESVFQERELRKLTTADTVAEMIKELRAQSTQKKEDE